MAKVADVFAHRCRLELALVMHICRYIATGVGNKVQTIKNVIKFNKLAAATSKYLQLNSSMQISCTN